MFTFYRECVQTKLSVLAFIFPNVLLIKKLRKDGLVKQKLGMRREIFWYKEVMEKNSSPLSRVGCVTCGAMWESSNECWALWSKLSPGV